RARGGMLVGTAVGAAAATLVCLGLWMFRLEPPKSFREWVSGPEPVQTPPRPNPPVTTQPTVHAAAAPARGDLVEAEKGGIKDIDENKPEELVRRGQWYWKSYAQAQAQNGRGLKLTDDDAKKAIADLQEAAKKNDPDACLQLGEIYELANDLE